METHGEQTLERVSDELIKLYKEVTDLGYFTKETLTHNRVDRIEREFTVLSHEAQMDGNKAIAMLLRNIALQFSRLHTVGVVENRVRFEEAAVLALNMVESALLALDGFVAKNRGKILEIFKENRER